VIEVDFSVPGTRVVRVLGTLAHARGWPTAICCDNGSEFAGTALDQWAAAHGVVLDFIERGKPVQNAYAESFNGRLSDECLNESWFVSLADARETFEGWCLD
jgi:putative transposase